MTENQNENDSFVEAMSQLKKTDASNQEVIPDFIVYPYAETNLNMLASIILVICIIVCIVFIILGSIAFDDMSPGLGWPYIGISLCVLLFGIIFRAVMTVFVNISRNLFKINAVLHERKNKEK